MKAAIKIVLFLLFTLCLSAGTSLDAQQGPPSAGAQPTLTSVLNTQVGIVEFEIVATAQAMPEDKYSFAPTNGEFKGVRTFAQQVKHIATVNDRLSESILGQAPPTAPDEGVTSNGPDAIQTKAQIVQYLKESFANLHKAIASIDATNALTPLKNSAVPFLSTRLALGTFVCTHAMDHYGQMVEYLRMNGIVPPMSAPRPSAPANPSK